VPCIPKSKIQNPESQIPNLKSQIETPLPPISDQPAAADARIHVVIVNYRTAALTIDALRSLESQRRGLPQLRVTVTDNASGDDSVPRLTDAIQANAWSWVTLMPLPQNGGFAYGNNMAIRAILAGADPAHFILLLNPDTLVRPGAVTALHDFMLENPQVGIAGSRLEDPDATPQRSAFRFHSLFSELDDALRLGLISRLLRGHAIAPPVVDHPIVTDWVAGASMMIRRAVFDAVGLMDEAYFMYYEEVDFCRRAAAAGWPCWYVPASRVVHLVGQASGVTDTKKPAKRRPAYWFESRRRYFLKNHGRLYATLTDAAWIMGFTLWRIRRCIQRKPDPDPPHMLADFIRHALGIGARS
jgi:GT2 family glycosyltransferase